MLGEGHSSSSTLTLASHVLMEFAFCTQTLSCWKRFKTLIFSEGKSYCYSIRKLPRQLCGSSLGKTHTWV